MRNEFFANIEAGAAAVRSLACSSADRLTRQLASDPVRESQNQLPCPEKPAEPTVRFSRQVLADFRSNVGRYAPETGGMMGSTGDTALVDLCHFDTLSRNTPGTFYYDVDSMTKVFHDWAEKGYRVTGIYHSHPRGCIRPSYHDISTALIHLRFFEQDFFYLPILRPARKGLFTLYFYIVHLKGDALTVDLDHVLRAESGSRYAPVCTVDGRQAAQVMIICGCDNGTTVQLPGWRQNLRFAAAWERSMEGMYPGFTRPVLFSYRFYNQDLTPGSLLIEIGGHGNNLNEALYAGQLAAKGLAAALLGGA